MTSTCTAPSSSTASGKTEAAFFPIIAKIVSDPVAASSVSVLYVAPLKSLINDQFYRLEELLDESGREVTHWHGDVGQSHKSKLLKNPFSAFAVSDKELNTVHQGLKRC